MLYDFNQIVDRNHTKSVKHNMEGKSLDTIPLWVADMDFLSPPEVISALKAVAEHGVFGYSLADEPYMQAIIDWYQKRFNWPLQKNWIVTAPGVVFAIAAAIKAFTVEEDAVLIQEPVYHPFSKMVTANNRKLVVNPLIYQHGKYQIDFDDFEKKIVHNHVKLFILCSPHNPVGRVWRKEELIRLGELCLKHQVLVIADEIHADFVYKGWQHHIFADLSPDLGDITLTCTAPSKTFNLAGLQSANIIIKNPKLKSSFQKEIQKTGYDEISITGLAACQAAYTYGEPWLEALLAYLSGNISFVQTYLAQHIPEITLIEPEGTYLLWFDCRKLGLDPDALYAFFLHKAKVWVNSGAIFGESGAGFVRVNIGCPRQILEQALEQLNTAVQQLRTGGI